MGTVVKGHVQRTHGQSQRGLRLKMGGVGEIRAGKWRQLFLNNNKKKDLMGLYTNPGILDDATQKEKLIKPMKYLNIQYGKFSIGRGAD